MADWRDMATESRKAASLLVKFGHCRPAVSRCYYAAFARLTHRFIEVGAPIPDMREGPAHRAVRPLIENNLTGMGSDERRQLSNLLGRMYVLRIDADYRPSVSVSPRDAREAQAMMDRVFRIL